MRIACISDTHQKHDMLNISEVDMLIHAGDFCSYGTVEEAKRFNSWLARIEVKYKIVIAGNHDKCLEQYNGHEIISNAIYLQDEAVEIEGVKFYGSPWQPEFCNWAFNLPRGQPLASQWAKIPSDTDVLITHGPSFGKLDSLPNGVHVGCEDLARRISELKLSYHIHGHVHHSYGFAQYANPRVVNASSCNEAYVARNEPIIIEV